MNHQLDAIDLLRRIDEYQEDHCWQYDIRLRNLTHDLKSAGMTFEKASGLRIKDFYYRPLVTPEEKALATQFIKRHEWLGTIGQLTTHWFGAYYHDGHQEIMVGCILMGMPTFSKMLGEGTRKIERLISRGACMSWTPKNLASSFLAWCLKWMVENTQYRLFVAYSDPSAKELGTIYQACNFYYLGQGFGSTTRYINPYSGKIVTDRFFRARGAYKKYAQDLGIEWGKDWNADQSMLWENIPSEIAQKLREYSKIQQLNATKVKMPSKHKYAIVLGKNKSETRKLRKDFEQRNKIKPYPKERGS